MQLVAHVVVLLVGFIMNAIPERAGREIRALRNHRAAVADMTRW